MKNTVLLYASAAVLAALLCCSCQKERDVKELEEVEASSSGFVKTISFTVDAFEEEGTGETRSTYDSNGNFYFAAKDTVGVFPSKGSQVFFEIAGEDVGKQTVTFEGGGWALKENCSYWSYYPLVGDFYLKKTHIPVEYVDLTQDGNESLDHISPVDFIYTDRKTVQNGSLAFVYHHLNSILRPRVTLPAGTYSKIVIQAESDIFVSKGHYDITAETPSIIGDEFTDHLTLNLKNASFAEETAFVANLVTAPVDISNMPIKVIIYRGDSPLYYYTYERTSALMAGKVYGLRCTDLEVYDGITIYTKVSSVTSGGTYLIVDASDARLFKGSANGSYERISPEGNTIIDTNGSLAGYEFTVENRGDDCFLKFNDGKYLVCDYGNNSSTGLVYVNSQSDVTYPYALTTGEDGAIFFSTTDIKSYDADQVLYYKVSGTGSDIFKIGGTGAGIGVHLYMKAGKLDRGLYFDPWNVTCILGDTPEKPTLSGIYSTVTYSSSNVNIARVDADGNVTPVARGIVTITATVAEDDQYNAGSASYTLKVKGDPTADKYVRVTSLDQVNMEGEYVLVFNDGSIQKVFKPILNAGKNAFLTSAENARDVYIDDDEIEASDVDDCRLMLANQDGTNKKFSLVVPEADGTDDYYFIVYGREAENVGNMTVFFASPTATGYRSTFSLSSEGVMTLAGNSNYYFKYSSDRFTASSGSSANLYLFVRSGSPTKQKQTLSFAEETVSWALGENYEIGRSYDYPQLVLGAQTPVTYSAEPESVAKIEGGRITIMGSGSATITATAAKSDQYYAATASYTLRILKAVPTGWVDMGTFNLENKALEDYLTAASTSYSDTDDATNTIMPTYVSSAPYSSMSRKDCPAPVTIEWTNPASSATVITIFKDQSLSQSVWWQNATENALSADVYNLIPGRKYYYTVSENSTILEKGYFNTTGRRRMIKVSDVIAKGRANNCRDFGGLEVETANGEKTTIKYGYLFRGTCMDRTSTDEKDFLVNNLKIGMDVDLRAGSANSPGQNDNGNSVCYQPFTSGYDVGYINPGFESGKTIADLTTSSKVAQVMTAIFNTLKSGKAVYLHCHIGADRTGYISMLIEGLLGVSEKDCSIDYELTSFSNAAGKRYRNGQPENYTFRDGIAFLRDLEGDTFQNKIENYLVYTVGISQEAIDDFKELMLEPIE